MRGRQLATALGSALALVMLAIAPPAQAGSGPQKIAAGSVAPQISTMTTALLRSTKASRSPMQLTVATQVWAPGNDTANPTTYTRLRTYFDPSGSAMWWSTSQAGQESQVGACDPQSGAADHFRYNCTFLFDMPAGAKKLLTTRELYTGSFAWINVHAYELATLGGHLASDLVPPRDSESSQRITKSVQGKVTTITVVRDFRPTQRRQTLTFTFTPTSVTRSTTSIDYTLKEGPVDQKTGKHTSAIATEHLAFRTVTTLAVTQPQPMSYPPSAGAMPSADHPKDVPATIPGW